jgi:uncharacterized protein (TIGR00299 family) protein
MKILYLDCFSGISGDMTIGALLDLGIDREIFLKELSGLGLESYKIEIGTKTVNSIRGTDVNVVLLDEFSGHEHQHGQDDGHEHGQDGGYNHDHGREHDHEHKYDHNHNHDHGHSHTQKERGLAEIEQILDNSSLNDNIKTFSKKVFREIAGAEAKVHGQPIDEVHFHEVGAVDSIVDIAGTAICLDLLGVEKVYSSVLHDGNGFIECRHGIIPVPVPAVMEMLAGSGIPLVSEDIGTELVTPTGMGLIKNLSAGYGRMPAMKIEKTGYGHGKRNTGRLNALRAVLGETLDENVVTGKETAALSDRALKVEAFNTSAFEEIIVLETNIDDTTSEIMGYAMSRLLDAGALDVFFTPIFMKKNRPATMLTVLAKPGTEDMMAGIVLSETSTLGIRTQRMKRYCMERSTVAVDTQYGRARVKVAVFGDIKKASPEYEDCRNMAESSGLPLMKVYEIVKAEAAKRYGL